MSILTTELGFQRWPGIVAAFGAFAFAAIPMCTAILTILTNGWPGTAECALLAVAFVCLSLVSINVWATFKGSLGMRFDPVYRDARESISRSVGELLGACGVLQAAYDRSCGEEPLSVAELPQVCPDGPRLRIAR